MGKTIIDDGYAAYLVQEAEFYGKWEIPIIRNENIKIPKDIIPYEKINKVDISGKKDIFVHFYMHDKSFRDFIVDTKKYLDIFSGYGGIISPDCSLYIDMPLCLQLANVYMNRAVGSYMQNNGIKVIPNVRWGDERSFEFAFAGLETGGVYAISTHGCIKSKEEKIRFKKGLEEMIRVLKPKKILLHGDMPDLIFKEFLDDTYFINYESWIARNKRGYRNGNE